jgi:hypothetical protein
VPKNVIVTTTTLAELRDRFSSAVGFSVELNHAYKLCDFKPTYGHALADILLPYDFWGHSDLDLFYGDLLKFLPEEALQRCLRIYHRGHLSIFRNVTEANALYRLPHPSVEFREVFRTDRYCHFDEYLGIEKLLSLHKVPEYEDNQAFADIIPRLPRFRLTRRHLNHQYQAFIMENGRAQQVYWEGGQLHKKEFMYVHLQKRTLPPTDVDVFRSISSWACTPQGFIADIPHT